jgi:DNA-binding response OmpR family regulator
MIENRFTKREAGVLDLLQRNAGQIVTRTFFLENVWGYKSGVKSRTLDVHISKLRAKLAIDPNLRIRAVVGLGYRLERGQPIESGPPGDSNARREVTCTASALG